MGENSCRNRIVTSCCACFLSQSAAKGALPILYAATADEVVGGDYYGPTGCIELKGGVGNARVPRRAKSLRDAKRLWEMATALTNIEWPTEGLNAIGVQDDSSGDKRK